MSGDNVEEVPAGYEDKLWRGGLDQEVILITVKHKDKPPLLCTINNWPEYVKEGGRIIISTVDAPEPLTNVRAIRLKEYTQQTKFNLTSVAKVVCSDKKTIPLYKVLDTLRNDHGIQTKRMKPILPEGSPLSMFNSTLANRGLGPPGNPHMLGLPVPPMYTNTNASSLTGASSHLQPSSSLHHHTHARSSPLDDLSLMPCPPSDRKRPTPGTLPFATSRDDTHDLHRGRSTATMPGSTPRDAFDLLSADTTGPPPPDDRPPAASEALMDQPIEWIGNPMRPEEVNVGPSDIVAVDRLYYRGFVRGDAVLRVGDCVVVELQGSSRRPQVASILLLWAEPGDDGSTQNFARCQAFCWPTDTIYADIHWPPGELFASDHCHDALPLHCLLSKCTVSFRAPTGNPDLMPMPGRPFPKTGYVCRFSYNSASHSLRPAPRAGNSSAAMSKQM